jgi:hypothetical protein
VSVVSSIDPEARRLLDEWTPNIVGRGRLRYNCTKWAILTAAVNGEHRVTAECMAKAIRFFEWQVAIRRKFQPGEADDRNREAQMADKFIKALKDYGADIVEERTDEKGNVTRAWKYVSWRRIAADRKWASKIDPSIILRTVTNLDKMKVIQHELYDDHGRPLGAKVRLVVRNPRVVVVEKKGE